MKKILIAFITILPVLSFAQHKKINHVIVIGVDGLGGSYMIANTMPFTEQLMKEGTYTLHARCIRPSSSACNWASMLMGAGPELAGYTKWDSRKPEIPPVALDQYGMFPSIYGLLKQQRPKAVTGAIYSWEGIGYLFPKQAPTKDDYAPADSLTEARSIRYIKQAKPDFLFIHFSDVDGAGHGIGWGTKDYNNAMMKTDERIANIVNAVKQAGIMQQTAIIITSDHGGVNKGHGGDDLKEMEIPWIIYGAGIKKTNRLAETVVIYDTAATIAWIFGLKTPQVWTGRPVRSAFQ